MRKLMLSVLMGALVMTPVVHAYDGPEERGEPGRQFEMMAKKLDLTEEQKASVAQVFADHREKMIALRDETQSRLDAILTEEQRETLNEMHEKRRDKMRERMGERMGGHH
ncbi:MAG: hypothetical protein P1U64_08355 [Alcanivoracaceae bacterium]|nr:hypothetical protein [Alcanivoracaceae bacterium]